MVIITNERIYNNSMNKSIRQNWKIFNNLKFYPLGKLEDEVPRDKKEGAFWCEKIWNHLVNDDMKRAAIFQRKGIGTNKYTITVWDDGEYVYFINVLRTEYNTDSTSVYIQESTPDNLQDFINIAKFYHTNILLMKKQSLEGFKELDKIIQEHEQAKLLNEPSGEA